MMRPTTRLGGHDLRDGVRGPHDAWPDDGPVADFTQHRIERALRDRVRYRYVRPRVERQPDGYRIESPCCSRNVDPDGGVIDIARLARDASGLWRLHARDHATRRWVEQCASRDLTALLDILCADAARAFWP
ncbi:DUF3024 domain-containing protein [Paraburkholderia caballeronis]|uniref:DUF3024 domain-containing protein n=1 Tax=Paraburkholderia caballeronis TaxID=416943 RepID=UPI0010E57877|nr:DUF3024 domain-containing protein [Paraburkholderia caballeronis]TDV15752.1 hypothetical protein C7408_106209 [Paraburkholderia caballeronis]TDV18007.1 hypothetical protein C7406_105209 [Paraburkholderia caballeronis]TDV26379.1 hypothetical protein C7404_10682 [Paraburkholderia caballeronis]